MKSPGANHAGQKSTPKPSIGTTSKTLGRASFYDPSSITSISLAAFFEVCFCATLLGVLSSIPLSHKKRKSSIRQHAYGSTCSQVDWLIVFSVFTSTDLSVNNNQSTPVHPDAILSHGYRNPGLMSAHVTQPIT